MGQRAYRRDANGKFAGAGGGTKVTMGRAGGFANASFRQRVASQRASGSKSLGATAGARPKASRSSAIRRANVKKLATAAVQVSVGGAVYAAGARALTKNPSVSNVLIANAGLAVAAAGVARARPKVLTGTKKR